MCKILALSSNSCCTRLSSLTLRILEPPIAPGHEQPSFAISQSDLNREDLGPGCLMLFVLITQMSLACHQTLCSTCAVMQRSLRGVCVVGRALYMALRFQKEKAVHQPRSPSCSLEFWAMYHLVHWFSSSHESTALWNTLFAQILSWRGIPQAGRFHDRSWALRAGYLLIS